MSHDSSQAINRWYSRMVLHCRFSLMSVRIGTAATVLDHHSQDWHSTPHKAISSTHQGWSNVLRIAAHLLRYLDMFVTLVTRFRLVARKGNTYI